MTLKRMRRVGTGHRHRIPRTLAEFSLVEQFDPQNRSEQHVAATRTQLLHRSLSIRFRSGDEDAHHSSAPFPKLVIQFSTLWHELRKQRGTGNSMILVPVFDLKFLSEFAASGV